MASNEEDFGGGTGGGGDDDGPNVIKSVTGAYEIAGKQVVLLSRMTDPTQTPLGPHVITILAVGNSTDGKVDVRGSQGVRVTAGEPLLLPTTSEGTNGVEIMVGERQNVRIHRGLLPGDQKIEITSTGITIDAGLAGAVTIKAGVNSITIDPKLGITIQGLPRVNIN